MKDSLIMDDDDSFDVKAFQEALPITEQNLVFQQIGQQIPRGLSSIHRKESRYHDMFAREHIMVTSLRVIRFWNRLLVYL